MTSSSASVTRLEVEGKLNSPFGHSGKSNRSSDILLSVIHGRGVNQRLPFAVVEVEQDGEVLRGENMNPVEEVHFFLLSSTFSFPLLYTNLDLPQTGTMSDIQPCPFNDLPLHRPGPPYNAWNAWGEAASGFGRLNLITPDSIRRGRDEIREGITINLK